MRAVIVVPSIREECLRAFLEAWDGEFREHVVIIVEDNPAKTFKIEHSHVLHFAWEEIEQELEEAAWIIPRRTDCIRSFGFYKAYQLEADMVVTLDDDCFPTGPGFLAAHAARLQRARADAWVSTGSGLVPRGMPYVERSREQEVVLNHGLWVGNPDVDAVTQLMRQRIEGDFKPEDLTVPRGMFFPMCGMNLAFKPDVIPALYFLLMGQGYPYDRYGDIWAGILFKKICDHLGYAITSGLPLVEHRRVSNVWANLAKEAPGMEVNERFWRIVDAIVLTETTFAGCYRELACKLPLPGEYWEQLKKAMMAWTVLYER